MSDQTHTQSGNNQPPDDQLTSSINHCQRRPDRRHHVSCFPPATSRTEKPRQITRRTSINIHYRDPSTGLMYKSAAAQDDNFSRKTFRTNITWGFHVTNTSVNYLLWIKQENKFLIFSTCTTAVKFQNFEHRVADSTVHRVKIHPTAFLEVKCGQSPLEWGQTSPLTPANMVSPDLVTKCTVHLSFQWPHDIWQTGNRIFTNQHSTSSVWFHSTLIIIIINNHFRLLDGTTERKPIHVDKQYRGNRMTSANNSFCTSCV